MPSLDRRRFLQLAGATAGAAAVSAALPPSIARAASIPASRVHGDIRDVQHIVVLMQENRSFDHYFGTLRGVRGFGDPHPAVLPSGKTVWHQAQNGVETLPFRPSSPDLGLTFIEDLAHDWNTTHQAFNNGKYDGWIPAKSTTTMAHLQRSDMPFHYALADAFTICDDYHCSLQGPTDPNRYYMWTGYVGNDGTGGGPVIDNAEAGYGWSTYPERLQAAGIDWKIYQDSGLGLNAAQYWGYTDDAYIGNYGDNSLLYFHQYQNAQPGDPLFERAVTGTNAQAGQGFFDTLKSDVTSGKLPQVSWVVAPEAFTEHPNWPANYGAWYVSQVLDALTADPEVWSKTVLLVTYDENDGFYDHVVPPHPSSPLIPGQSTVPTDGEFFAGSSAYQAGGYGMGQRVPMTVVSPWSTGGWVCSETFDHTSIIRFIEARFGVGEPNISAWRRAVAGDLTAAFDFSHASARAASLPSTAAYVPPDADRHPDFHPVPPAQGSLPHQEPGTRPSRALGYALEVDFAVTAKSVTGRIRNTGRLGAHVQARSLTLDGAPFSYTVEAGKTVKDTGSVAGPYDLDLHGPNGFFRRFTGDTTKPRVEVTAAAKGDTLSIVIANTSSSPTRWQLVDAFGRTFTGSMSPHARASVYVGTAGSGGWYDVTVTVPGDHTFSRVLSGRLETGRDSHSDPRLGA